MDVKNGQNAQAVYLATRVNTASKEQLLLLTYEIGIRACRNAEGALSSGTPEDVNKYVKKGQDVLRELMVTLDMGAGGMDENRIASRLADVGAQARARRSRTISQASRPTGPTSSVRNRNGTCTIRLNPC